MTTHAQKWDLPKAAALQPLHLLLRYGLALLLIVLIVAFSILRPSFVSPENITGLIRSASISMLMFLGLTWVLAAGEIDVSFVSIAALANMTVAGMVSAGHGWPLSVIVALTASLIFGTVNGVLVAYFSLPALVVTIATGGMASALAAGIGLGSSIVISGTGFVGEMMAAHLGAIPVIALVAIMIYAVSWYLQERLVFGHYIYAMAQNRRAVIEAGIPAQRLLTLLYIFAALTSGIAGILLAAELSSGQPSIASSLFLDGLTSVLLGGVMIKLGKPNVIGTAVGVLILAVLVRGGALVGWIDSEFEVIKGGLLMVGVAIVIRSGER